MSSEQPKAAAPSSSLADRISRPAPPSAGGPAAPDDSKAADGDAKTSWADEVASPTTAAPPAAALAPEPAPVANDAAATVDKAQNDGASELFGGSDLREPDYNVEVKLSDIQADPNNPLYSVKSFEELGGL